MTCVFTLYTQDGAAVYFLWTFLPTNQGEEETQTEVGCHVQRHQETLSGVSSTTQTDNGRPTPIQETRGRLFRRPSRLLPG